MESIQKSGGVSDLGAGFTESLNGLAGEVVEGAGPDIVWDDGDASGPIDERHLFELVLVPGCADESLVTIHDERALGADRGDLIFPPAGVESGESDDAVGGPSVLRGKAEEKRAEVIGLVGLLLPGDGILASLDHRGHGGGDGVDLPEEPASGIDRVRAERAEQAPPGLAL